MNPMLEIARGFLRSEREAASKVPLNSPTTDSHSRNIFPEQIYTDIDSEIKRLNLQLAGTGCVLTSVGHFSKRPSRAESSAIRTQFPRP